MPRATILEEMKSHAVSAPVLKTLLVSDLVASTRLVEELGDERTARLFRRHDRMARDLLAEHAGREIDKTDGFLMLFERPMHAVEYALRYHAAQAELSRQEGLELSSRVGIHLGEVCLLENAAEDVARGAKPLEVEGLAKPVAARLMSLGQGRQTLLSRIAFDLARRSAVGTRLQEERLRWLAHGSYLAHGVEEPFEVFEVGVEGAAPLAPPADSEKMRRVEDQDTVLGWRPAAGLEVPHREGWFIDAKLGEASFGETWLATHGDRHERRVFKFCYEARSLKAFQREVTVVRLLEEELGQRDDVARILRWDLDQAPYYIELEYAEDGNLPAWAEAAGGLHEVPLATRLYIVMKVAEALGAAHSVGVLHRGLRPGNILVRDPVGPGAEQQVSIRLINFGQGRITDRDRLARAGITALGLSEVAGDPAAAYVAPELATPEAATVQADVYALGVILYQMVVGDLTRSLKPGWERDVDDQLVREDIALAVAAAPRRRLGNALTLAERLSALEERRRQRQATDAPPPLWLSTMGPAAAETVATEPAGPAAPAAMAHARFLPGTRLSDRYRIVELIGKGGMGEVYRAHDLKLGHPVALKLLPEAFQRDRSLLARFFNEIRTAREVTHPNVCRVHDVGEADGLHFLSMEHVDGEDLASLLRQIGRIPRDKALEIARQLCAGLAAIHEQGILHRDLKPANVLIDGRGRARITDFGLAMPGDRVRGAEVRAGTPAYMAPEQLAGDEVTVRSEIYALGLVLYELFTGQAPFPAALRAELAKQRENAPVSPSSLVEGLDPAVERVILGCLENDPASRPRSVHEVAAALPGGDPLAAAIAVGDTPSPELVAAAGEKAGLSPRTAWACLLGVVLGLVLLVWLAERTQLTGMAPLDKSPEVLTERAREIIRAAGYPEPPRDSARGFIADRAYLAHVVAEDESPRRWDRLRDELPHPVRFWYRQSPRYLVRWDSSGLGRPSYSNPPALISGMVGVHLDPQGRLRLLEAVPPELDVAAGSRPEFDWTPLFSEAGLDRADFEPVEPFWVPPAYADRRAAWRGAYPGSPRTPIEIQAAAYRGKPVAFRIIAPWTTPSRIQRSGAGSWIQAFTVFWFFASLLGAALVAWRNLRLGRGDRKAASRLALFMLLIGILRWLLGAHHVPEPMDLLYIFIGQVADRLFWCGALWTFYIAFEPYLRRLWPRILVSWIRLLDGRFRDPLVGRDVVVGCCGGLGVALLMRLYQVGAAWLGQAPLGPDAFAFHPFTPYYYFELIALGGLRHDLWAILTLQHVGAVMAFLIVIGLLLLRLLLRRTELAIGAYFIVSFALFRSVYGAEPSFGLWVLGSMIFASILAVLFRFGFLALVIGAFVDPLLRFSPLTLDPSTWYAEASFLSLGVVLGLTVYGLHVSLGGQPLFRDDIFAADASPG